MRSTIYHAVRSRNRDLVEDYISSLRKMDEWSLVSIIDELTPLALMESNLKYGSFHRIKMALFLRRLAVRGLLSKETEREMARLVSLDLADREWVCISGSRQGLKREPVEDALDTMVIELDNGNAHNAYYYALSSLQQDGDRLLQELLKLGTTAIPDTLGHSISCFWPVVEDIIYTDQASADSALLSYILYLCRYSHDEDVLSEGFGSAKGEKDLDDLLVRCASGEGIVNLHHMITFYIGAAWERSSLCPEGGVPWGLIEDWVGDKETDQGRYDGMEEMATSGEAAETYEDFAERFTLDEIDESVSLLLSSLEQDPESAIDWIFRTYGSYYSPEWDPHYITGLYCALELYLQTRETDRSATLMAIDQAVRYFAQRIREK